MSNKVEDNQNDLEPCSHMLLTLGYDCQYIVPIEDGQTIINILVNGYRLKEKYGKKELTRVRKFEMEYMTVTDINVIRIENGLLSED